MAARKKDPSKEAFVDPYPRQKPPEKEEPANWKMVMLQIDLAQHAAKVEARDKDIVDTVEHHLHQALRFLHPPPAAV